jgi:hypothetical protein
MEAEVFLLGHWKDYDELETSLSMPELLATLEAQRAVKWRDYKFQAAMQGVSLPDAESSSTPTFEDIQRQAMIRAQGGDPESNDVLNLKGRVADEVGFGIGVEGGLSYSAE